DYMINKIMNTIPYARVNGHMTNRLPNNTNFSFQFVEGESLLIMLDMNGICASTGSACTSSSKNPSHVLTAIGLPEDIASGSLRLTISHETTKREVDIVCNRLAEIITKLRSMSPQYEDFQLHGHS
ncbi:MAG: aminotransferase class V-fold PLP-dependent enzyme, partial [Lachnospiraceae bacterium]|nr:aminotransferase class V-fold PLP-dependent enzyme [Lachnospiraceae bacterium]